MQLTDSLDPFTGDPVFPPDLLPQTVVFTVMPKDVAILNGYIDEFHHADTQVGNTILEKAMGDIYRECPQDCQFDKKAAKLVSTFGMHICMADIIMNASEN